MQRCLWCGNRGWKVDRCGHLVLDLQTELLPVTYLRLSSLITISFLVKTQTAFLIMVHESGFDTIHRLFINLTVRFHLVFKCINCRKTCYIFHVPWLQLCSYAFSPLRWIIKDVNMDSTEMLKILCLCGNSIIVKKTDH